MKNLKYDPYCDGLAGSMMFLKDLPILTGKRFGFIRNRNGGRWKIEVVGRFKFKLYKY